MIKTTGVISKEILEEELSIGIKAVGRSELKKYLENQRLSPLAAIRAACYQCCGGYQGGRDDCTVYQCPLHPFMPYREGGVQKLRTISPKHRSKLSAVASSRAEKRG